jgi:hypothetical protein
MARKKSEVKQDLSSFMAILIMTIGALVVLLVANTVIIMVNPENTAITSIVTSSLWVPPPIGDGSEGGTPFPRGNMMKEPVYIDVHPDRVILYSDRARGEVLPVRELERPGNVLEQYLEQVHENRHEEYVVLLVRPRSALVSRRMAKAVRDRDIDLGWELFEAGREVNYEARRAAAMEKM